jgi:glucose dehydrogenase
MSIRAVTLALATAAFFSGNGTFAATGDVGWTTNGGDHNNNRYAPLTQITPENVKTLGGAWRTELPGSTSKASPIIDNGVIYVAAGGGAIQGGGGGAVYALDAKTGAIKWTFSPQGAGI